MQLNIFFILIIPFTLAFIILGLKYIFTRKYNRSTSGIITATRTEEHEIWSPAGIGMETTRSNNLDIPCTSTIYKYFVAYEYTVNGTKYHNEDKVEYEKPEEQEGRTVKVWYKSSDPSTSQLDRNQLKPDILGIIIKMIVILAIMGVIYNIHPFF